MTVYTPLTLPAIYVPEDASDEDIRDVLAVCAGLIGDEAADRDGIPAEETRTALLRAVEAAIELEIRRGEDAAERRDLRVLESIHARNIRTDLTHPRRVIA